MWHEERDYASAGDTGLNLLRTYNSNMSKTSGFRGYAFGSSWSTKFDARIEPRTGYSIENPNSVCFRRRDTGGVLCGGAGSVHPHELKAVAVIRGDGKEMLFVLNANNMWVPAFGGNAKLSATYAADGIAIAGWTFTTPLGGVERFDEDGVLLSMTAMNGRVLTMTYGNGNLGPGGVLYTYPGNAPTCPDVHMSKLVAAKLLICVTDDSGRRLQFEYDTSNRISKMIDPAGEQYLYEYDGLSGGCTTGLFANERACKANNLTAITYPNSGKKTYHYNEYDQITPCFESVGPGFGHLTNSMTGITDENGARHMYWQYDCGGFASGTKLAENANAYELKYAGGSSADEIVTTVRRYFGDKASNQFQTIITTGKKVDGMSKNIGVSKPCAECGKFASSAYDAKGRVTIGTDWAGNQTTYTYDPVTGLETSRVEGFGSPVARTITTEWDLTLRLATAIAEPKRITRITYDGFGSVLTRTVQATTDLTGVHGLNATVTGPARKNTFTYTARGQLESVRGPRTDVVDLTTYSYDPATGALATATNALNQTTIFSNFDAHGRPGKVTARGVTTTVYYTNRGWLDSTVATAGGISQTTKYDYDLVGQVKKITQTDGTFIEMKYDDAHRLIKVLDNVGNSVEYDLDVLGVRTAERHKDPTGTLARQISRSLDLNNAISTVTGAAQ
jgi:YD repeat-containing protein